MRFFDFPERLSRIAAGFSRESVYQTAAFGEAG
jgi:hypothetical protein